MSIFSVFTKKTKEKSLSRHEIEANYYKNLYHRSISTRFDGAKSISIDNNYQSLRGFDYSELQEKAYIAMWDSVQGRGILKQMRSLTINTGLKLQSMPEKEILKLTAEEANEKANIIEANFKLWRKQKECDYEEKNTFNQLEQIAFLSMLIFGEFFAILRYSDDEGRINPLQIQIIPPHMVTQPTFDMIEKATNRGNRVEDGIELDKQGREVAIYTYNENETKIEKQYKRLEVYGKNTKRKMILHGFIYEEPGQIRGIPFLAPIIQELTKITDLELAELDSASVNASLAGAIKRVADVVNNQKLNNMGLGWSDEELLNEIDKSEKIKPAKYEERKITRGGFVLQNLEAGESLDTIDTKRPNLNIPAMIDKIMEYACPAIGISLEAVKMLFGQNYSASKGALELNWRNFQFLIQNFSSDFEQEVFIGFMWGAIAKGDIIAAGFENPIIRAAWTNAYWSGLPIPSLNPFVEAKAAELRVNNGFSNRENEAQNSTGTSFDDNIERLQQENQKLVEANQPIFDAENNINQENNNNNIGDE